MCVVVPRLDNAPDHIFGPRHVLAEYLLMPLYHEFQALTKRELIEESEFAY